jgi:hypothetical protein
MKRICDYKGSAALILMGDIMDYLQLIFGIEAVQKLPKGSSIYTIMGTAMKAQPEVIIRLASRIREIPETEIEETWSTKEFWDLFGELYGSMEIRNLFTSQRQATKTQLTSTGSAMENTEDGEK